MANYNIDIGVKIQSQQLDQFNKKLRSTETLINNANKSIRNYEKGNLEIVKSINGVNAVLNQASKNFREVAVGTPQATRAAKEFVKAEQLVNKTLAEQEKLLQNIRRKQQGKEFTMRLRSQGFKKNQIKQSDGSFINQRRAELQIINRAATLEDRINQTLAKRGKILSNNGKQIINNNKARNTGVRAGSTANAASSALIGGAFPLLFGQGLGASVGGAAGGFIGGKKGGQFGFALSLLGTVLGSQLDRLAQSARELGEALRNPIKNVDLLTQKIGQVNTPFGDTVNTLKEFGLEAVAAEQVLDRFNKTFNTNRKSITEVGKESIRFQNELARLGTAITLLVAGPLSKMLATISDALGAVSMKTVERRTQTAAYNQALEAFFPGKGFTAENTRGAIIDLKTIGRKVDGMTFDQYRKSLEPGLFSGIANESGLGGQESDIFGIARDFNQERLQALIKERRDFELLTLQNQLEIEKQSLTMRSEDLNVLKRRMDLLKIEEKLKVKGLVDTKIMTAEQQRAHQFAIDKLEIERQISKELLDQAIIMADPMQAALVDLNKEMEKFNDFRYQAVEFAKAFGSAFQESFKGIIKGTMTVQDAFRNMFNRIADHFLDMAAQMIANQLQRSLLGFIGNAFLGGIGGGGGGAVNLDEMSLYANTGSTVTMADFGGFANGGRPPVGRPSIVGERGPELFVPDRAGTIIPNHAMGGSTNIVVNVDASGSSVEGDAEQSRELGRLISVAIQSELIKQKRPGGMLA